jgi:hypothetical protein
VISFYYIRRQWFIFFYNVILKINFKPLNAIYLKSCLLEHGEGGFLASKLVVCPPVVSDNDVLTWKFGHPVIALGW